MSEDRRKLIAFSGLLLAMLLGAIDQTIVATALPSIASDFGALDQLFWVVTAYLVTVTAVTPLYGKMSDMYGRRLLTQTAIGIFLIGSALCGLSQSMLQLALFRGIQGIGGGGLMAMSMAGIGDIFSPRERGKYMSYLMVVFGAATVGGPLLGGILTDALSWRWIFYINIPLGILAIALVQMFLDVPVPGKAHQIDYGGVALLVITVSALVAATSWGGNRYAWDSWQILGLMAVTITGTVLFLIQERRVEEPILSFELFNNQTVLLISALSVLVGGAMMGGINYLPLFMRMVLGITGMNIGILLLPFFVGYIISAGIGGQLMTYTGRYKFLTVAGLAIGTAGFYLLSTMGSNVSAQQAAAYMVVTGFMGITMPTLSTAIQNAVDANDIGEVTSLFSFGRGLGGALGVSAFGIIFNRQLTAELNDVLPGNVDSSGVSQNPQVIEQLPPHLQEEVVQALAAAFHDVFLLGVVMLGVGFFIALVLPDLQLKERSGAEILAAEGGGPTTDNSEATDQSKPER